MPEIKGKVVIEEGGMRFVLEHASSKCVIATDNISCNHCRESKPVLFLVCKKSTSEIVPPLRCTSCTEITNDPRIYHAWDREDARSLVGEEVEFHSGDVDDEWAVATLDNIGNDSVPFFLDVCLARIIREIPKITMTREEAGVKYGIPKNVIIEGVG